MESGKDEKTGTSDHESHRAKHACECCKKDYEGTLMEFEDHKRECSRKRFLVTLKLLASVRTEEQERAIAERENQERHPELIEPPQEQTEPSTSAHCDIWKKAKGKGEKGHDQK
ncbi:hypothetical protein Tco_1522918 [Tanacetum coccineum]